jgi:hypothetical protein
MTTYSEIRNNNASAINDSCSMELRHLIHDQSDFVSEPPKAVSQPVLDNNQKVLNGDDMPKK